MKSNVRNMVLCSLFASLMALCGWITLPVPPVGVTMQTFGLLLTLGLLGGKRGSAVAAVYLLLGIAGLPVFSGFRGGISALLDATGGFLWGFLAGALVYWAAQRLGKLPAMVLCQLTCYVCGCLWFSHWAGSAGFWAAAATCVAPFLIPDGIKLWLAWRLSARLQKHIG